MNNNETIHDRIKQLVDTYGNGKNTVFASIIGSNEANVRGYKSSIMPKFDFLEKIARNFDIDLKWLLTGEGSMLREEIIESKPYASVVSAVDNGMVDKLFSKLDEKDKIIVQQSEEIGKLRSQLDVCQDKLYDSTFTEPCISDSSGHKKSAVGSADAPSLRK